MTKRILTCALLGNGTTRALNPALPITPAEIAADAIAAWRAGAAIAHIHVRDPETEKPAMEVALYAEVVDRIRDVTDELIINLTTGTGSRYQPAPGAPGQPGPRTSLSPPERRAEHVAALKPDIATLDLNTMWFGADAVINSPDNIRTMARIIRDAGARPEIELFDSGDIALLKDLVGSGDLAPSPLCSIVMGVKYGFAATPQTLGYATAQLPPGAIWTGFATGRMAYPMMAVSAISGGHIRIGLEDAVRLSRDTLAPSNAAMVEKAKRLIADLGYELASAGEARRILGLRT
ncbi:BKACE family enzyme [Pseudodonghicola flavimaris]|uniref:3-keto-5-aminohexanoate cleavage protein n=1 Tax=Pseudodonghicola flavimaris TaxID=3050036 RepID=A0ABT7F2J0_9RHOB|nr:3-keto-5-aminohexanoate cleavage protein [Pseudodonghicola flavimaris]MDK3018820.1 3-keto-5-aminohexanoate cleavage protein [Pseudodonghicola flavimaris]